VNNLNFPRLVILFGLLGSAVLGYFVYERTEELETIETDLRRAPKVVNEIQSRALELNALQHKAQNDKFKGIDAAETYVREICADPKVGIGQVLTTRNDRSPVRGVRDDIIRIQPATKDRPYTRDRLGNFLYKLEAESQRVRVTQFTLEPVSRIKPGEIGDDRWTFTAELTSRTRTEDK